MFGDSTETTNSSRSQSIYSFLGNVYVVVNLLCQVIFVFLLFLGMVMVLMKLKQKENKNYLR